MTPTIMVEVPEWSTYEAEATLDGGTIHTTACGESESHAELNLRSELVSEGWDPTNIEITIGEQSEKTGYRPASSEEIAAIDAAREEKSLEAAADYLRDNGYEVSYVGNKEEEAKPVS